MSYEWRVSIPSWSGKFERCLSSDELLHLKNGETGVGKENYLTFALLIVSWVSLLGDAPFLKTARDINRFFSNLVDDPVAVIREYSEVASAIESALTFDNICNIAISDDDFAVVKKTPIVKEFTTFTKSSDPALLKYILSFLNFGKKVYYKNPDLDTIAFRKWDEVEDRLGALELPPWINNLRIIMGYILGSDEEQFFFMPRHGSGSVAEVSDDNGPIKHIETKNDIFTMPKGMRYLYIDKYRRLNNIAREYIVDPSIVHPRGEVEEVEIGKDYYSRLMFVPKSWKTTRSICLEPVAYQWAQQAVRSWLERKIAAGCLRNHVVLQDQTVNQKAAQYGSFTGLCDTIDLSSASDSVAWSLVKAIIPAGALKHLAATRTSECILPDGSIRKLHKYAPMGSATCFPTQSLVYSAIVTMVTIADAYNLDWKVPGSLSLANLETAFKYCFEKRNGRSNYFPFKVYGDDIVCDNTTTSSVVDALTSLGFDVNNEKSFTGKQAYRESCGGHYYLGEDVTPFRFKTKEKLNKRASIELMVSLIDKANLALDYNYINCRKALVNFILRYPIQGFRKKPDALNPILFTEEDQAFALRSVNPRNTHLRTRTYQDELDKLRSKHTDVETYLGRTIGPKRSRSNVERSIPHPACRNTAVLYQRNEVRSLTVVPGRKKVVPPWYDNYFYIVWWRSRIFMFEAGFTESGTSVKSPDVFHTTLGWRWTPIP